MGTELKGEEELEVCNNAEKALREGDYNRFRELEEKHGRLTFVISKLIMNSNLNGGELAERLIEEFRNRGYRAGWGRGFKN